MKKVIFFLFTLQLIVGIFYMLFYVPSANFYELIFENSSAISLGFNEDLDVYHIFLNLVEEEGLIVSRVVYPDSETTIVYTTDVTLGNRVPLIGGEFPTVGSSQFISTLETGEAAQIGLIADIVPGHQIIIRDMHHPQNFGFDGRYHINTTNPEIIGSLIEQLQRNVHDVHLFSGGVSIQFFRSLLSLERETAVLVSLYLVEFIAIFPIIFLCMLTTLLHYVLKQLKSQFIFSIYGYSSGKMLSKTSWELIKILMSAGFIAYLSAIIYLIHMRHLVLFITFTRLFIWLALGLILFYLCIVNVVLFLVLRSFKNVTIIKGQTLNLRIQLFNHVSKFIFTGVLLFLLTTTFANFIYINERLSAVAYWEMAENVYLFRLPGGGPIDWENISRYDGQKVKFYHDLIDQHNGFMMNSSTIQIIDDWNDENDEWAVPTYDRHLLDRIDNLEISPNFLELNPIDTVDGISAYHELIWDDAVLNVLLPERFKADKEEIHDVLLTTFDRAEQVNLIPVKDDQYYFSFDHHLRIEDGNRIRDPLAIIFAGPAVSEVKIASAITNSVYFIAKTNDPFSEIEPLVNAHGLGSQIRRLDSVYDQNVREIRALQEHQTRLVMFLILLAVVNVTVSYHLIANYFERHKFQIFLKSIFGWTIIKQNKEFLITYLVFSMLIITFMSGLLGGDIFLLGILVLVLDIFTLVLFQKRFIKKSFSEIMKGER